MDLDAILAILLVVGIVAAVFVWETLRQRRTKREAAERAARFRDYAARREWDYAATDSSALDRFTDEFRGDSIGLQVVNVLRGHHDGRPFTAFEFSYRTTVRTGTTRATRTEHRSVVTLDLGAVTPGLWVSPAGRFDKVVDAVTGRDVEVGNVEFDKAFTVVSPAPDFARDVLTPAVVDLALKHRDLAWQFEKDALVVMREGQHTPPEIEARLNFMDAVLDRVPDHVRVRLLGGPEEPR